MRNQCMMNNILSILLVILITTSYQKNESLILDKIKKVESFVYNSQKENNLEKTLDKSFENLLRKCSLYSNSGEYWDNLNFNIYPICFTINGKIKTVFVLKKIEMIDGKLSELYLIKINENDQLIECKRIAKHESTANCESNFILTIKRNLAEIAQNETCDFGSQNDDENEETTKEKTVKTSIALNK